MNVRCRECGEWIESTRDEIDGSFPAFCASCGASNVVRAFVPRKREATGELVPSYSSPRDLPTEVVDELVPHPCGSRADPFRMICNNVFGDADRVGLSDRGEKVYMRLLNTANVRTEEWRGSWDDLADLLSIVVDDRSNLGRAIKRALAPLVDAGWVHVRWERGGSGVVELPRLREHLRLPDEDRAAIAFDLIRSGRRRVIFEEEETTRRRRVIIEEIAP